MYSIIIAILAGLISAALSYFSVHSPGWAIAFFFMGFLVAAIILFRVFGKKLQVIVGEIQVLQQGAQAEVNKMVERFQKTNRGASPKLLQSKIDKVMVKIVDESIEKLQACEALYNWNIIAKKQQITIELQLYYQVKNFEEVDKRLDKAWCMEPVTWCIIWTPNISSKMRECNW